MKFEWDEKKNQQNIKKHNVSFQEAETVFDDPNSLILFDEESSIDEERYNIIGIDLIHRRLIVCHCYRGYNDEIVRIISARVANKLETQQYEEGLT